MSKTNELICQKGILGSEIREKEKGCMGYLRWTTAIEVFSNMMPAESADLKGTEMGEFSGRRKGLRFDMWH
jgi:hypothetical protein